MCSWNDVLTTAAFFIHIFAYFNYICITVTHVKRISFIHCEDLLFSFVQDKKWPENICNFFSQVSLHLNNNTIFIFTQPNPYRVILNEYDPNLI